MSTHRWSSCSPHLFLLGCVAGAIAVACGTSKSPATGFAPTSDAGSDGTSIIPGGTPDGGTVGPINGADSSAPTGPVSDFPATPVQDGTDAGDPFGPASGDAASGGPCLYEPEIDSLYPQNWLRPRFSWTATGGENLFELRLHVANQVNDLVVLSVNNTWTMPVAMWNSLRADSAGQPMTVTIRGGVSSGGTFTGESEGTSGPLGIAPVEATGAIVYWTTTNSSLKGFSPGDESVVPVLTAAQVTEATFSCIGCHTSTPGGEFAAFAGSGGAGWPDGIALIDEDAGTVGSPPSFLGAGGIAALAESSLGIETFSLSHWDAGDHIEVVANDPNTCSAPSSATLEAINLEATTLTEAQQTIARNGDPNAAGAPAWTHDGRTIAYVSTNHTCDGRLGSSQTTDLTDPGVIAQLYTVPYNGGDGGTATPLPGASDPSLLQFYPSYSADDNFIAFNRTDGGLQMYNQPASEIFIVPASGGTATRLSANDPPACVGKTSPGLTNSWAKWSPVVSSADGNTYYWLIFSSTRDPGGNPQLYMTGVVEAADGGLTTHGAVYLWNQPSDENNHTPAWDTFKVTPQPPPPPQ